MAPTRKEKTKTDLDHALRRCIEKREEWQAALEIHSATLSIERIKSWLDQLSDKWEHVVSANLLFVDNREYGEEPDTLELETFDVRYKAEKLNIFNIKIRMEEMADLARLKKEADSQPLPPDQQVLITAALDNMRQRRKGISEDIDSLELTMGTLQDGLPGDSVKYHRVTPDNIRGRLEAELFPLLQEQKRLEPARVVELQAEHSDFIRQQRSRIDASLGILYSKVVVAAPKQS